jgi:hypothetical protein
MYPVLQHLTPERLCLAPSPLLAPQLEHNVVQDVHGLLPDLHVLKEPAKRENGGLRTGGDRVEHNDSSCAVRVPPPLPFVFSSSPR